PLSERDLPARFQRSLRAAAHRRGPHSRNAAQPVRHAVGGFRDYWRGCDLAAVSRGRSAARRPRPLRVSEAPGIAGGRRSAPADVAFALLEGRARVPAGFGPMSAAIEPVVGRYVHLDYAGRHYRVDFEGAGEGVSLVCVVTA